MSDETTNGAAAPAPQEAAGPAFSVEKIYVKDVSFESPNSPAIFGEAGQPDLQLNLNQRVQRLNENAFEVSLRVTLTCKVGEKTAYVAEVDQAGVFGIAGLPPQGIDVLLGTQWSWHDQGMVSRAPEQHTRFTLAAADSGQQFLFGMQALFDGQGQGLIGH